MLIHVIILRFTCLIVKQLLFNMVKGIITVHFILVHFIFFLFIQLMFVSCLQVTVVICDNFLLNIWAWVILLCPNDLIVSIILVFDSLSGRLIILSHLRVLNLLSQLLTFLAILLGHCVLRRHLLSLQECWLALLQDLFPFGFLLFNVFLQHLVQGLLRLSGLHECQLLHSWLLVLLQAIVNGFCGGVWTDEVLGRLTALVFQFGAEPHCFFVATRIGALVGAVSELRGLRVELALVKFMALENFCALLALKGDLARPQLPVNVLPPKLLDTA